MGLLVAILLGALVGYIAAKLLGRKEGFIGSVVIGVVGAFIGSVISHVITGADRAFLAFDLSGLLWSLGGSVVLVLILNAIQGRGKTL